MHKKLLSFLAIVLVIGFSAFSSQQAVETSSSANTLYYWYRVVNGTISPSTLVTDGPTDRFTKQDMQDNHLPCTLGTVSDCVRGFVDPITEETDIEGEEAIQKNN